MGEFERLGDVLRATIGRVAGSDAARAYEGWAKAAGEEVAAVSRPRKFARGLLTVDCESAAWANELNYLAPMLLERLAADDPETPVQRLRFVVAARALRSPGQEPDDPVAKSRE
jgi:predicted nucleic acid-binding Zn ribbon protein